MQDDNLPPLHGDGLRSVSGRVLPRVSPSAGPHRAFLPYGPKSRSVVVLLLVVGGLLGLITAGCSSTGGTAAGGDRLNPERVQAIAKLAAYAGTVAYLKQHPEQRPAVQSASAGLQSLVAQERWDTTAVATVLTEAGFTEMEGSEGALVLMGGLMLTDAIGLGEYDAGNSEHVRAAVTGIAEGVRLALVAPVRVRGQNVRLSMLEQLRAEAEATRTLPVTRR